ncbi:hypothetical protein XAC2852_270027 [Xanthomonas citri pv. citri]|nr:hypothetical protein XAC2852_270027 [Xanthomonas citri pv. citri]
MATALRAAGSDHLHCIGLQALLALHDREADLLTFLETLEALDLDRAEMHEDVFAIFAADESKAFGVVEPLHDTIFAFDIGHLD